MRTCTSCWHGSPVDTGGCTSRSCRSSTGSSASRGIRARTEVAVPPRSGRLRPMSAAECYEYLAWVVDDYAEELQRNGKATGEAALAASRASFDGLLPDGVATAGQTLLVAEDHASGDRVGLLWFGPSTDDPSTAWIYDITVD